MVVQLNHVLILHQGFAGPVNLDQSGHQFHMETVIEGIHIQRAAADADDVRVLSAGLQHFNVGIDSRHVLVVHRGGLGQCPLVLLGMLQQVALVLFQQLVIQAAQLGLGHIVLRQAVKDRIDLIHVDGHVFRALPVIGAAVGNHAGAQCRINLVQQHAQAADQRLQGVLRVRALFLVPQGSQQFLVRDPLPFVQDQILNQGRALFGLDRQLICLFLIYIDKEVVHHLNANGICHGCSPSCLMLWNSLGSASENIA